MKRAVGIILAITLILFAGIGVIYVGAEEPVRSVVIEDGVTGFMVDKQRPDLLADRMERLANDPNLRKQMGSDAKIKFEKEFTLTIFERNFMDCLNQMI